MLTLPERDPTLTLEHPPLPFSSFFWLQKMPVAWAQWHQAAKYWKFPKRGLPESRCKGTVAETIVWLHDRPMSTGGGLPSHGRDVESEVECAVTLGKDGTGAARDENGLEGADIATFTCGRALAAQRRSRGAR